MKKKIKQNSKIIILIMAILSLIVTVVLTWWWFFLLSMAFMSCFDLACDYLEIPYFFSIVFEILTTIVFLRLSFIAYKKSCFFKSFMFSFAGLYGYVFMILTWMIYLFFIF